ncbi:MAG: ATP-binding protein [Nocardioides sp.]
MRDDLVVDNGAAELRLRLAADPVSVPGARRFVADGLSSWGLTALVDDATLCVSELAGNAALHSASPFMDIAMHALTDAVRISVEDHGAVPPAAVVPRPSFPDPDDELDALLIDDEPTTGRGLAIVSILADDWGVEETEQGKRIWVELSGSAVEHGVRQPRTDVLTGEEAEGPEGTAPSLPDGWALVRLAGCPVALSLRQDQHLDELVRELQLIATDRGNPRSEELARELDDLLGPPAHARHTGRRIAQQAAAAGLDEIDVDMAMPRELADEVRKLQNAVRAADRLCEEARLLTLASPPDLRELRDWMTEEISRQIEQGAVPVPWSAWRAARRA